MTSEPRGAAVALLLSAGAACVGYAPGLEVAVSYEAAPMTLAVLTDDGGRVQLDTAELAIEALELVPCDAWTAALGALGPARAWAHGVVEGESAGGVRLDVLHDGGTSVAAGVLRPLPGRYCAARLHLERLAIEGRAERGGRWTSLAFARALDRDLRVPFDAPMDLDADALNAGFGRNALRVRFDAAEWFDGIGHLSEERLAEAIVTNVLGSFTLVCNPRAGTDE